MQYVPPLNGDFENPDRPYVDADPQNGVEGSIPSGMAFEHPQRELLALIEEAGLEPDGDSLTQVKQAVLALIAAGIQAVIGEAPAALDTLVELAAALGDDEDFATNVVNALDGKLPKSGGVMTGSLELAADPTEGLEAATKDYVDAAVRRRSIKGPFQMTLGATAQAPHGLGWTPKEATVNLICVTAQYGFIPGQRVPVGQYYFQTSNESGVQVWWDNNNFGYIVGWGNTILFDRSGSGQGQAITPANWNFEILLKE